MSFSYKGQPTIHKIDEMRFLVQDTKSETHLIEDEEIQYVLDYYNNDKPAACAKLCEIMAQAWARKQEISVSNYRQNSDSIYKKLIMQADRFRKQAINSSHFRVPSISKSDKEFNTKDEDIVQPSFKRDLMDNPQANLDPFDKSDIF